MSKKSAKPLAAKPQTQAASATCPVCGDAQHLSPLCEVDGFQVYACATCKAEHAFPPPSSAELKAFYDRPEWFEGGERGGYKNYDAQTDGSAGLLQSVLDSFPKRDGLMVLDVGCGYGTHLKAATDRGWKCFGVEISDHARKIAKERLGPSAYVVENIGDLFSHEFDLILMLDMIEHLPSPYPTLYQLFTIGAITPKTRLVIATPNAGSAEARREPAAWAYRHPPSHLVYYTADALTYLLRRLHFKNIDVRGLGAADPNDLTANGGLLVTAQGSDFMAFMHERYVPGTWSKIAAYEHVPRYALTKALVKGKSVLDFGCGTGYGAAMLAETAAKVTGLDIDDAALVWAREVHRQSNLDFVRHDDLGASLPNASFDVVTCFEMIEHVDHATQKAVIASIARLMKNGGVFLISTPNPEVTKHYDANPFHIREMTEAQFRELLSPHFPHLQILRQHLQPGIAFESGANRAAMIPQQFNAADGAGLGEPLAYIAICSRKPMAPVADCVFFDGESDYIGQYVVRERTLNLARFEAYRNGDRARELDEKVRTLYGYLNELETDRERVRAEGQTIKAELGEVKADREAVIAHRDAIIADREAVKADREAILSDRARIMAEFSIQKIYHEAMAKTRAEELSSPRFLARQLWRATKAKVQDKFRRLFSRP